MIVIKRKFKNKSLFCLFVFFWFFWGFFILCLYVSWERGDHKGKYAWLKLEAAQKFHVLKA